MAELAFYRQKRFDGGIRMGIESDETTLFENFEVGPPELEDELMGSALEWFIDIRCQGDILPNRSEEARHWFASHGRAIQSALLTFAETIQAGLDDAFPVQSPCLPLDDEGTRMRIVCSATRRITRQSFSRVIAEFAQEFPHYVQCLTEAEPLRL